jgi:hypothetical protein
MLHAPRTRLATYAPAKKGVCSLAALAGCRSAIFSKVDERNLISFDQIYAP